MVEERVAAVLGRLDHARVLVRAEREPVRAGDAGPEQRLDRLGDVAGVGVTSSPRATAGCVQASAMPRIPASAQPWKTATFSAPRDPPGGLVERVEVDVVGAALEVAQLGARDA